MPLFLEALFIQATQPVPVDVWQDHSTTEDHVFVSGFGTIALRRRVDYPRTFAYVQGQILKIGYGNRFLAEKIASSSLNSVDEAVFYDDEFMLAILDCSRQTVTIQRDAFSTLPLFSGVQTNQLALSNSYERVCSLLNPTFLEVDNIALTEFMCGFSTHHRTLFKNIRTLYDRVRLNWSHQKYEIIQPIHGSIASIAVGRPGNPRDFLTQLEGTLDKYWLRYSKDNLIGCELSGGMDSSAIVGYFADKNHHIKTVTLQLTGRFGTTQTSKLNNFNERFKIQSSTTVVLDSNEYYPLDFLIKNGLWHPFYHWQITNHALARDKLLVILEKQNVTNLFTGRGGNELCEHIPSPLSVVDEDLARQYAEDKPEIPWTPTLVDYFQKAVQDSKTQARPSITLLPNSVVSGTMRSNNVYIDRGIWPVSPLADPRLYLYCQSLPIHYRVDRNLMRMYLHARRFPKSIYTSPNEHFGDNFYDSVSKNLGHVLEQFMEHSVLDKNGLVEKEIILDLFNKAKNNKSLQSANTLFYILRVLIVEINFQALGVSKI